MAKKPYQAAYRVATGKATVQGHGTRVPYTHQPAALKQEFRLDRAASLSSDVKAHKTTVAGTGHVSQDQFLKNLHRQTPGAPFNPLTLKQQTRVMRAAAASEEVHGAPTKVSHVDALTHEQRMKIATEHVKQARQATQARTQELNAQLGSLKAGSGFDESKHPRDSNGQWTNA